VQLDCNLLEERRTAAVTREKINVQGKSLNWLFGFRHNIWVKHCDVSVGTTASFFRVTEFVMGHFEKVRTQIYFITILLP
jgi:hypothetical protein